MLEEVYVMWAEQSTILIIISERYPVALIALSGQMLGDYIIVGQA